MAIPGSNSFRVPAARAAARPLRLVLLAQAIIACLGAPAAMAQQSEADDGQVTTLGQVEVKGERDKGYTVDKTDAALRLELAPRQIPQSFSVFTHERIEDQNLQTIGGVLENVTGVSGSHIDSERYEFYARGFYIDNFQFDGIPTTLEQAWNYGDSSLDLALYDRVEVVRGATGLLTGAGNPSASVNLIRKHADSRELAGSLSYGGDSWGGIRATADVTTPLNASGSVRARVIGNYTQIDSHVDRYEQEKSLGYAVIDADLGENTLLSVGYDYQKKSADGVTWGGFPVWYSDGSFTHWPTSFNAAADWTYWDTTSKRAFASLEHGFGNGWKLKLNATHDQTDGDSKLFYPYYTIYGLDKTTGGGVVSYSGWYISQRKVDGLDAYADGPFRLFGREHQLIAGASYNRRRYVNTGTYNLALNIADYSEWDGSQAPEPDWGALAEYGHGTTTQKAAYAAARFSLADPLTLIAGARYTQWESRDTESGVQSLRDEDVVTPYAGLVYDIGDTWSVYASYTDIFQPQDYKDAHGTYLDPVTGKNYEAGVKAAWFGGQLNGSLAVFRVEQDNVAQDTGQVREGTNENIYVAAKGTVSEGFDLELSGELATGWNATFGASHYTARDADGTSVNKYMPRTTLKLFTSYTPQGGWNGLTVGGGVNWRNRTYYVDSVYGTFQQDAYALVGLFARYRITPQLSLQANVDNLLDKRYYSQTVSAYSAWGASRSGSLTFTYTF